MMPVHIGGWVDSKLKFAVSQPCHVGTRTLRAIPHRQYPNALPYSLFKAFFEKVVALLSDFPGVISRS